MVKFNSTIEQKEYFNVSNSELISNQVSPLALDSLGNVWMWKSFKSNLCFHNVSTEYLVSFDGEEWTYYSPEIDICDHFGLYPKLMEIDNNNAIWIGTNSSGLLKFDGNNWSIFDTTNSMIPTNRITDLAIDKENNIWIVSDEQKGLIKYDNNEWIFIDSTNPGYPNELISNIEIDDTGKIWLTAKDKIITFENNIWETIKIIIPNQTDINPLALEIDSNNEPWFIDNHLYHLSKNVWKIYPLEPDQQFYYTSAFFIDDNKNKWMNSKRQTMEGYEDYFKGGLAKFDSINWSIYSLSNSKFKGNGVGEIFKDNKNNIWFDSRIITKINDKQWNYYRPYFNGAPVRDITSINEDTNGNIWFGTYADGLIKFDGMNWEFYNKHNSNIPSERVFDIEFDNEGNIWFTTDWQIGLVKFDGISFTVYDTTNSGIPSNYLHQVECDSKGNIWFGAVGKGLVKFDQNTWTLYSEQLKWNEVSGLFIDNEDCIWIGGAGLTTFKDGIWSYYEHDDSIGYYMNNITDLTKDEGNNIWATARLGLYKFDGNNWQKFNHTNSGLPDEFMGDLEFDQYGNLWIGTSSGVILYKEGGVVTEVNQATSTTVFNKFVLSQNYPNPFNPTTTIKFTIPLEVKRKTIDGFIPSGVEGGLVRLLIYDILGREVATLVNQKQKPGNYEVNWEASNQPSGIYFYQLTVGNYVETKKMILLR